eukprot:CAMPEP_0119347804 /NCGR_PEP_ID=MMETSP1333-20130426/108716_1 /TAXON_ID=418940 /ORGANISM="Scyphosphaera apsteinii, Strain RCC1455" /LENGTH=73 /DNA_ID=CAMNT_0007360365 /DNA_START=938 /DNA_END=1159 /DNA_ORIENTATION=+
MAFCPVSTAMTQLGQIATPWHSGATSPIGCGSLKAVSDEAPFNNADEPTLSDTRRSGTRLRHVCLGVRDIAML